MGTLAIISNWPLEHDRFAERIDACDEVVRFSHCEGWGNYNHEPRWIPFDATKMSGQYPCLLSKIRPLDAASLTWIHPAHHPTTGLVFLHHVLQHDLFHGYRKLLISFDFVKNNLSSHHAPDWEKATVENWVTRSHFERLE